MEGSKAEEVKRGEEEKRRRGGEEFWATKTEGSSSNKTCTTCPLLVSAGTLTAAFPRRIQISHQNNPNTLHDYKNLISHVCPVHVFVYSTNKPTLRSTWLPLSLAVWTIDFNLVLMLHLFPGGVRESGRHERQSRESSRRASLLLTPASVTHTTPHHTTPRTAIKSAQKKTVLILQIRVVCL